MNYSNFNSFTPTKSGNFIPKKRNTAILVTVLFVLAGGFYLGYKLGKKRSELTLTINDIDSKEGKSTA